ncbi:MAG: hypothetical protein QOG89_2593 [Thermomicrobiales bacterium]|nr:hypothetical protein [Thermomicrobiales bacterium]
MGTVNLSDASIPSIAGEWVYPTVSYIEPKRLFCALCGRPIARRYWRSSPAGEALPFCEPAHADLYVTYWLPTYGHTQRAAS